MNYDPKQTAYLLLGAGALPLLIYPGVVLGAIMGMTADWKDDHERQLWAAIYPFLIGSLAYPVVYGPCASIAFLQAQKSVNRVVIYLSLAPLAYLLLIVGGLVSAWAAV